MPKLDSFEKLTEYTDKILKEASESIDPDFKVTKKKSSSDFEPLGFNQSGIIVGNNLAVFASIIHEARITGIVGIEDNGKATKTKICEPGVRPWFHFDCTNHLGATFNIISDGKEWYPIDRRTGKVTDNMTPKSSINLREMSKMDRCIINKLIRGYV